MPPFSYLVLPESAPEREPDRADGPGAQDRAFHNRRDRQRARAEALFAENGPEAFHLEPRIAEPQLQGIQRPAQKPPPDKVDREPA